MLIKVLEKRVR